MKKASPSLFNLFCARILHLRANKRPNFIALDAARIEISHCAIVIFGASASEIAE